MVGNKRAKQQRLDEIVDIVQAPLPTTSPGWKSEGLYWPRIVGAGSVSLPGAESDDQVSRNVWAVAIFRAAMSQDEFAMRAEKRSTRLKELEEVLLSKRQPIAINVLAEMFGVHRSTINRMLHDLENEWLVPIKHDVHRSVWIDRARYLTNVKLSLDEALAVFLASRLLARYADKPNPHAVTALRKLDIALQRIAPNAASCICSPGKHPVPKLSSAFSPACQPQGWLCRMGCWRVGPRGRRFR